MNRGYDYQQYAVLYVDDETQALKYFEKAFHKDFRILTASSAADAWEILEQQDGQVGVLITDQKMPVETGVSLLERVRSRHPNVVRILTTAYSDLESAIEAVNAGGAFRYVTKPWELADVKGVLLRAMEFFLVRQERDRLLREKLSVLQRMLVMDRLRGMAGLAAAVGCCLRDSMGALRSYIDQAPHEGLSEVPADDVSQVDLWSLARSEGESLVTSIREVLRTTAHWEHYFVGDVEVESVARGVVARLEAAKVEEGVTLRIEATSPLPQIRADVSMLERLIAILVERISNMDGEDRVITLQLSAVDQDARAPGIRLLVTGDAPQWSDSQILPLYSAISRQKSFLMGVDMDILAAFFIAHHHGGKLVVRQDEPGFEVLLAQDPQHVDETQIDGQWFDEVFASLEDYEMSAFS